MLNADLTTTTTLVTALSTQIAALSGLTGSALAAQQALVLSAGNAARVQCAKLCGLLGVQRQTNARAAIAAVLDLSTFPALGAPIESWAPSVKAMADQSALFADYSNQADKGLASYELLPARWTALQAFLTAEPGLITG